MATIRGWKGDMAQYARIEKRTVGVYNDESSRLVDLEFELPGGWVVRRGESQSGTVVITAPPDRDHFCGEFDPAVLADLAERFEAIGS